MSEALAARLEAILRATPQLMAVMGAVRALDLPDWMIFSGAVYQPVLNHLTGRDPDYGIKDYDVAYFDPNPSWDAEDAVIRRVAAAFDPPLRDMVEVRNQGRVHLWFEGKFGEPYSPLACSADALKRFVSPAHAVGVHLGPDDQMTITAPFGLEDLFALRLRPNPERPNGFMRVAQGMLARWPELQVQA